MEADFGKMFPSSRKKGGGDAFETAHHFGIYLQRHSTNGYSLFLDHTPTVSLIKLSSSSLPVKVHLKKKSRGRKTRL
jgi:hypothetical protein